MPDAADRLADSWDHNAGVWTRAVRAGAIPSRRAGTDAAAVAAVLDTGARRVLDVGCGEGWLARALADHGLDVTGVDGASALVAAAQAQGGGTFRTLNYAEIEAAPEALGGPFEAAVCNFALLGEVLDGLLMALGACVVPGGALVVQTLHPAGAAAPYADGWREETFAGMGEQGWAPMPWYFRTFGSWIGLLRRTGWAIEAVQEPLDPATARPLSLVLIARRA